MKLTCRPLLGSVNSVPISSMDLKFEGALKRVLQREMREMACKHCQGCEVDHPSQIRHFHLMAGPEELVLMYYEDAFQKLSEGGDFMEAVWDEMKGSYPEGEEDFHRMKYCNKDSFAVLAGKLKEKVEKEIKCDYNW